MRFLRVCSRLSQFRVMLPSAIFQGSSNETQRKQIHHDFQIISLLQIFSPLFSVDILMLFWGIHLCYTVRKAPTKFNESKFISWSIYNMTVCIIFMKLMK